MIVLNVVSNNASLPDDARMFYDDWAMKARGIYSIRGVFDAAFSKGYVIL